MEVFLLGIIKFCPDKSYIIICSHVISLKQTTILTVISKLTGVTVSCDLVMFGVYAVSHDNIRDR